MVDFKVEGLGRHVVRLGNRGCGTTNTVFIKKPIVLFRVLSNGNNSIVTIDIPIVVRENREPRGRLHPHDSADNRM